jgi:peptidoglycan/LPS O-acetylase OafA/YrhL
MADERRSESEGGTTLRPMPPLDGVRALAVAAVFAYHADLGWAKGGFLGVDVFFVLSGFLITSLLLVDHERHGRIRLRRFWTRRARRLLPALAVVLAAVSVAVPLLAPDQGWRLRGDLLAAIGYVSNWRLIYQHQSYFQAIGRPPMLQHLWTLAVEEQFYLVWPLVMAGAIRLGIGRRDLGRLILVGAVGSATLMAVLYDPSADPSRVYYGTDTRVAALLVGAALACLWPVARRRSESPRRRAGGRLLREGAGIAALGGLAACVARVGPYRPGLYRFGFLGIAGVAVVLVSVGASERRSLVGAVLGSRPLVWLGRRSYAVYLWFWPVFMLTRPHADVPLTGLPLLALRAAITLLLAAASYRFVEQPLRNGALGRAWAGLRTRPDRRRALRPAAGWGVALAVSLAALGTGVIVHRGTAAVPAFAAAGDVGAHVVRAAPSTAVPPPTEPATTTSAPPEAPPSTEAPPASEPPAAPAPTPGEHGRVTVIGESVLLEVQDELAAELGEITVDASIGRQMGDTVAAAHALHDSGTLGDEAIVQVGNNGVITGGELDELLGTLSGMKRVVVVNVKVPRPWEEVNNSVLAEGVPRAHNAVLVDWNAVGSAHPELFTPDGVHLKPAGMHVFAQLVVSAL